MKNQPNIPLKRLITATYPAEKTLEAFKKSAQKGVLKIIIDFT